MGIGSKTSILFMHELRSIFLKVSDNQAAKDFKFILGGLNSNKHLTIGFYHKSKTLDVHLKNHKTGEYSSIIKMTLFRFFLMMNRLGRFQMYLLLELIFECKINPGKLKKHNLLILPQNTASDNHRDLLRIQKKGKKFRLNTKKNFDEILDQIHSAEKIVDFKDEACFVYDNNLNYQGFAFNFTFLPGIYFITKKKYNRMGKKILLYTYNYLRRTKFENKKFVLEKVHEIIQEKYNLATID